MNVSHIIFQLVALARKAVQLDPDSGEGWISLGTMLANSIDRSTFLDAYKTFVSVTAEADAAFQRGLVLQPGYSRGYLWYGHFLRRKAILDNSFNENTSYDMAWVEVWRQGLEVDPLSLDLHVLISVDSPPEDSLWHAQRAVEIAPDSPLGFLRLGEVLWVEHGRVDESIRAISKAAELDPRNPDAPWHNGLAYTALGDYEMARAYFRLLKVRVEDTRLETMFGEAMSLLLLNENRTDEAVLMLEEFLSRNQKSFWPLWILASIDVSTGQADKALMRFREQLPECFDDSRPIKFLTDCSGPVFLRILQEVGDEQTAQRVAADITADLELPRESAEGLIKARYYAMAGLPEDALSALELYLEKGLRGYTSLSLDWRFFAYHDVTLDSIRDHPRFRRATVVIEADMAQQLQNVREMEQRGEVPNLEAVNALIESAQE